MLLILFASILYSSFLAVYAAPGISVKLSGPDNISNNTGALMLQALITNTGDETLNILNHPNSLLSDIPTNKFDIIDRTGQRPKFIGAVAKYVPEIAAAAGAYTVIRPVLDNVSGDIRTITASTNIHTANITGDLSIRRPSHQRRASFVSCTPSQQTEVNDVIPAANSYATNSRDYLNGITNSTARYNAWFGVYTVQRRNTVLNHFSNIAANSFTSFTYDCSCQVPGVYAYVYPDEFGDIYLCPGFFRAPNTGTDSKAGTLVHEASHFTENGGTEDIVYGHVVCSLLATMYPDRAVTNADSHEYFAESDPART